MKTSKPRKQLNQLQKEILEILYKFRFATVELIIQYQELDSAKYTYKRLQLLVDKGYIGRNYNGHYKIHGKQASYYLLKNGIQALREDPYINAKALNGMYKEGLVGDQFIEHSLGIFRLYNKFIELCGEKAAFFTKNELIGSEQFPKPLPDGYVTIETDSEEIKQFMLEVIEAATQFSVVRRKVLHYIEQFESDDWDEENNSDYPALMLICENGSIERRTQRLVAKLLNNADIDDFKVYTTTVKAVLASDDAESCIWTNVLDPDETLSLNNL